MPKKQQKADAENGERPPKRTRLSPESVEQSNGEHAEHISGKIELAEYPSVDRPSSANV